MASDPGIEYGRVVDLQQDYRQRLRDIRPLGINPEEPREAYHVDRALRIGEPYLWAPPLCRLVERLASTIPGHWTLHRTRLPSAAGFFAFATPLAFGPLDEPCLVPAMAWYLDGGTLEIAAFFETAEADEAWIQLTHWREGDTLNRHVIGTSGGGPGMHSEASAAMLTRLMAGAFALLEQELLVAVPARPSRAWRRRADAACRTALVRVVTLRRQHVARDGGDRTGEVEWSCRWIVRGHWRDQWYPRLACHQPVWIMEHEKGPEDMPLKPPTARLFAVVR